MGENKLKKYREKRDFSRTKEPSGTLKRSNPDSLKFSVQRHAARADHFDLRLEFQGVALSWAIPKGPSFCTNDKRLAMRVEDHPVDYMDFEGTIPKGEYGGGCVMLWDEGEWIPKNNPQKGLKSGSLKFSLKGSRLKGDWALVRMKQKEGENKEPWLLIKERDEFSKKTAGISRFQRGVRSGKSMREIAKERQNPFQSVQVMLAQLTDELPKGKNWIFELKYDGHRTLGFLEEGTCKLMTRNGYSCTERFMSIKSALEQAFPKRSAVFDGEAVVTDERGIPDFGALQAYLKNGRKDGLNYVIFDLLALDGKDLREEPLIRRKELLKELLKDAPPLLSYSEHTSKMTKANLKAIKARGMEGIVAKRADSKYSAGKNGDWVKIKFRGAQEFVVGGYTLNEEQTLKSLLVGEYEEGELKFVGKVGTGFSADDKSELLKLLKPLHLSHSPFQSGHPDQRRNARFVKPELAVQIEYAERTSSGLLRQASYKGIRTDKSPREIVAEKRKLAVELSHPEKILFPNDKITKRELAEYYDAFSERMLPYLKDRFLSLVCCPSGIEGERFFRRHLEGKFVGVKSAPYTLDDEKENYFYVTSEKGILSLIQYNAIEFHVRGSKKSAPKRPDVMVFDLDPDEGLSLDEIRRGARLVKELLEGLNLRSFLKTSGGKGYHIVVPFRRGVEEQAFRDFSKKIAEILEKSNPDLFVSVASKKARVGKIYLDWQRNSPMSTSVAPYSVRARDGAPVSMPIAWEELDEIAPQSVTLKNAPKRLKISDPWRDFFSVKERQTLKLQ